MTATQESIPAFDHFVDSPYTLWRVVAMRQWGRRRVRHVAYFADAVAMGEEAQEIRR